MPRGYDDKANDAIHINVAEFNASIKGMNMVLRWGLKDVALVMNFHTYAGWPRATVSKCGKVHSRDMAEMLLQRWSVGLL